MGNKPNKGDKDISKDGGKLFKPVQPPPSSRPSRPERDNNCMLGVQEIDDISSLHGASNENFKKARNDRPNENLLDVVADQEVVDTPDVDDNTDKEAVTGAITEATTIATDVITSSSSMKESDKIDDLMIVKGDEFSVPITAHGATNKTERSMTNPSPPSHYVNPK